MAERLTQTEVLIRKRLKECVAAGPEVYVYVDPYNYLDVFAHLSNPRTLGGNVRTEERLTLQDAAEALGISEQTARRWVKSGKLRAYKPGLRYLIPASAIEELLEGDEAPKVLLPFNVLDEALKENEKLEAIVERLETAIKHFLQLEYPDGTDHPADIQADLLRLEAFERTWRLSGEYLKKEES